MAPVFYHSKVTVFYVLGGPGAGGFICFHHAHVIQMSKLQGREPSVPSWQKTSSFVISLVS